ncbi:hypothetical protein [Amycolatopsis nigrescens]|uniref:hypothetical protein n=1 Tax=Amycolatopsis nigrescens TaxID=381445 RepID=UPI000369028C|nr:hypothetical protein [Amycolatopsis nigrescens]
MTDKISDFRVSIRQLFLLGVALGIPYGIVGLVWALTHNEHLAMLDGVDKVFSFLGEMIAWPVLIFSDVTLR